MKINYKTAYENVLIANKMLENENRKLKKTIDKAIDYLKSDNYWLSQVKANDELLDILKGSDKE